MSEADPLGADTPLLLGRRPPGSRPLRQAHTPGQVYPPARQAHPLGRYTPWAGTPPLGQVHPPGRHTPQAGTPPWAGTPPRQVHPQEGTPPWVGTPQKNFLNFFFKFFFIFIFIFNFLGDIPNPPAPPKLTQAYGQRAAGTHPTGMHSCYVCIAIFVSTLFI